MFVAFGATPYLSWGDVYQISADKRRVATYFGEVGLEESNLVLQGGLSEQVSTVHGGRRIGNITSGGSVESCINEKW